MRNFVLGIFLLVFVVGCNEDDASNIDCSEIVCTHQFISFGVTVQDASGVAIPLDSFSVTDVDTGEDLTRPLTNEEFEEARRLGAYPLYDDLTDANSGPVSRTIIFKGFIGTQEVVRETYSAGRGCCHSSVGDGELNLILD